MDQHNESWLRVYHCEKLGIGDMSGVLGHRRYRIVELVRHLFFGTGFE